VKPTFVFVVAICVEGSGTFVLVLDCDMIVHPDFLQNILGHFYKQVKTMGFVITVMVSVEIYVAGVCWCWTAT
jgi:cellulose synthase/poly-beta-1,6-N-acetylglucosamine synthase-like glycosyltransferase